MGSFNDSRNTLWDHELSGVRKRGETPQSKRWREIQHPETKWVTKWAEVYGQVPHT